MISFQPQYIVLYNPRKYPASSVWQKKLKSKKFYTPTKSDRFFYPKRLYYTTESDRRRPDSPGSLPFRRAGLPLRVCLAFPHARLDGGCSARASAKLFAVKSRKALLFAPRWTEDLLANPHMLRC